MDVPGNRVFQTIVLHMRTEKPDPKTGKTRAVAIAQINCSPTRCSNVGHDCRACLGEAKIRGGKKVDEFIHRESFENAGAHHLMGDYEIPVIR